MYTGLIEATGTVAAVRPDGDGCRLRIATETTALERDGSISVSGVCLTADRVGDGWFEAVCSHETVERTYLADLEPGATVNIEHPVGPGDTFDGHVVKGTVDTVTHLTTIETATGGNGRRLSFAIPDGYARYLVEKGNVALDGISLTVAGLDETTFDVAVVPRTDAVTTLSDLAVGDPVHFEADLFAKYAHRRAEVTAT